MWPAPDRTCIGPPRSTACAPTRSATSSAASRRRPSTASCPEALIRLAPEDLEFTEIPIGNLPLYSPDYDANYPPEADGAQGRDRRSDAVLFVTPEYNRSIPGALKNAIDWASRPWGQNSFDHIPAGVIGASIGQIGTAVAQQSLRAVLSFCNARQMTAPEAYITFTPELFPGDGEVTDESTRDVPADFMAEFRDHIVRVLTVLPRGEHALNKIRRSCRQSRWRPRAGRRP